MGEDLLWCPQEKGIFKFILFILKKYIILLYLILQLSRNQNELSFQKPKLTTTLDFLSEVLTKNYSNFLFWNTFSTKLKNSTA